MEKWIGLDILLKHPGWDDASCYCFSNDMKLACDSISTEAISWLLNWFTFSMCKHEADGAPKIYWNIICKIMQKFATLCKCSPNAEHDRNAKAVVKEVLKIATPARWKVNDRALTSSQVKKHDSPWQSKASDVFLMTSTLLSFYTWDVI